MRTAPDPPLEMDLDGGLLRDRLARGCVRSCLHLLSVPASAGLLVSLLARRPGVLAWLRSSRPGVQGSLRRISFARMARSASARGLPVNRLFRVAAIEGDVARIGSPCVYAVLHSSWSGALSPLLPEGAGLRFLAAEKWEAVHGSLVARTGDAGRVLELVRHLRSGKPATAAMDQFVPSGGVPVAFLGFPVRVRPWAVELARAGRVPVVPAVHRHGGDRISVLHGPAVVVGPGAAGREAATRELMAWFEGRVREDPSCWSRVLPFLGKEKQEPGAEAPGSLRPDPSGGATRP